METRTPSKQECPNCGESLSSWAINTGHCSICLQALPDHLGTPANGEHTLTGFEKRLPTVDESISGLMDDGEDSDEELHEDTMRYTKSNTRVLLQEDAEASREALTSPSLTAIPHENNDNYGYEPTDHLLTEEATMPGNMDWRQVLAQGEGKLTLDRGSPEQQEVLVVDDDESTIRTRRRALAKTQLDTPQLVIEEDKATAPQETTTNDDDDTVAAKFKQVKAVMGSNQKYFDPYALEEQHTLSQPLDIEAELRKHKKAANPHIAASFSLSQTLQDLSVKEVEELKLKPPPKAKKREDVQKSTNDKEQEQKQEETTPQTPEKKRLPSWVVWLIGMLLWVGVGALIWKIATAPTASNTATPANERKAPASARPTLAAKMPSLTEPREPTTETDAGETKETPPKPTPKRRAKPTPKRREGKRRKQKRRRRTRKRKRRPKRRVTKRRSSPKRPTRRRTSPTARR